MRVVRDGNFDSIGGNNFSTPPKNQSLISPFSTSPDFISSGTYTISFGELLWLDCTLTCQQSRYIAIGGTQIINVSGRVTSTGPNIVFPARIIFSIPFSVPSGTQQINGVSSVMADDGSGAVIQSSCWFDPTEPEAPVIINAFPPSPQNGIWFTATIILPIA